MITSTKDYSYLNTLSNYKITDNAFNNVIIYKEDNQILGYLDYSIMYERGEINYIFVLEQYRSKGIASKLLEYMINNTKVEEISLEVNKDNSNAIKLYRKYNFKEVGIRKGYYNGVDGILMLRSRWKYEKNEYISIWI